MLQFGQLGFPEMYERALVGPLFQPWAEDLIARAGITQGDHVLDVACGTGIVSRLARARVGDSGRVVGVDVNAAMLAVARGISPDVDWREGDAAALSLAEDERFDVVVCQQGLQFFPDRAAALAQMRRALTPGGRLALSVWRPDEEMPFLHALRQIAERRVGPVVDRRHSFGDGSELQSLLSAADFQDVHVAPVSRAIRFADGESFVFLNALALVGMSAAARNLSEEERHELVAAIVTDSASALAAHSDAAGLTYEIGANVATAHG